MFVPHDPHLRMPRRARSRSLRGLRPVGTRTRWTAGTCRTASGVDWAAAGQPAASTDWTAISASAQMAWLREHAHDIPNTAIQELVRIGTPFTHLVRTATADHEKVFPFYLVMLKIVRVAREKELAFL